MANAIVQLSMLGQSSGIPQAPIGPVILPAVIAVANDIIIHIGRNHRIADTCQPRSETSPR
jgi:hypothetical protein